MNRKEGASTLGRRLRTLSVLAILLAALHYTVGLPTLWDSTKEQANTLYQALPGISAAQETTTSTTSATAPTSVSVNFPAQDDATAYAFRTTQPDGTPLVRDACRPLTYYLAEEHMPAHGEEMAKSAFAEISKHSGLTINFGGYDVWRKGSAAAKDKQNIYVQWYPNFENRDPAGPRDSLGFAQTTSLRNTKTGYRELLAARISLNLSATPPFDPDLFPDYVDAWYKQTLLHEIGHVLGLDHVDDPGQVMHDYGNFREGGLGAGDIAGLAAIGKMCD